MAGLELYLDASGVTKGAQDATRALDSIAPKATAAEQSMVKVGKTLQVTAGAREAAQSITSTATALSALNAQGAAFSASKLLIDITRISQDFREMATVTQTAASSQQVYNYATLAWETVAVSATAKTGRLTTVFRTLGMAIRANPIGLLATALAGAAAAMSLFGSSTEKANQSIERQSTEIEKLIARATELDVRRGYTGEDPRGTVGGTVDVLTRLRLRQGPEELQVSDLAALYGISENDARYALGMSGMGDIFELRQQRTVTGLNGQQFTTPGGFATNRVSRQQAIGAGEFLLQQRQTAAAAPPVAQQFGPTSSEAREQAKAVAAEQAAAIEEQRRIAEERMERMVMLGEMLGDSLGNAFADAAMGAQSLRQALAGVVADFARMGMRQAFSGLFGSVAGSFGSTAAQGSFQGPPTAGGAMPGPVN